MLRATESSHKAEVAPVEVRSHLERLLASPAFRSSKRCQRFLAYVVGEVLEGRTGGLKERTLAFEVFDRAESFHSGDDTIVRVGAREVRKRLAQYYTTAEGAHEKVRIELPPGSYVPEFVSAQAFTSMPDYPPPEVAPGRTLVGHPSGKILILTLAGLIVAATILLRYSGAFAKASPFDEFWAPVWQNSGPVLIAIAHLGLQHAP